jgi:hypothetical protein
MLFCEEPTRLVVTNHDIELAIVDVDILLFTLEQDQDIRQLISDESGIPFDNIRLAYTHTHSGPITFSQWIDLTPSNVSS